jgi:DNA-directed RNA polymerase subunit RPC12/RpoP
MKINCPHCGAKIESNSQTLVKCGFCSSSFMLEADESNKHSLIQLNKPFGIKSKAFIALKMTKQPHDEGVRMDYLVKNSHGDEFILMVEDENIALIQNTQEFIDEKFIWSSLLPNSQVQLFDKQWLVTQKRALNGKNKQSYLSNQSAELLILTFTNNRISCQQGKWLDAFEISHEN